MHVGRIARQLPGAGCRQRGVVIGLVAGGDVHVAVLARFLGRLLRPRTGDHVIRATTTREVHRQDGVLGEGAALHEQDAEMGGDRQQGAQVGFGLLGDRDELLAPVAHFHDAHAAALPVQHLAGCLLQHLFGKRGRSGREIEGTGHGARKKASWKTGRGAAGRPAPGEKALAYFLAAGLAAGAAAFSPALSLPPEAVSSSLRMLPSAACSLGLTTGRASSTTFSSRALLISGRADW